MADKRGEVMSVEEFLALDRETSDQKYEFRYGKMVAMSGGSTNHTMLISNMQALIHPHVRKQHCLALVEERGHLENTTKTCTASKNS